MSKDDYLIQKTIGQGGQGVVYLAIHRQTGDIVCIKKVKQPALEERRGVYLKEQLHHPGIVRTIEVYEDQAYFYHVMSYIQGKSLKACFHQLSNYKTTFIGLQLLEILDDIKQHQMTFNDLKPDNVLVDKYHHVHLVDYGAMLEIGDQTSQRLGSIYFVAPEYLSNQNVSWKADVYSLSKLLSYICKSPNHHLKKWLKIAGNKNQNQRFKTMTETYHRLKCHKVRRTIIFLFAIVTLCCLFSPHLSSLDTFLLGIHHDVLLINLSTKHHRRLFHSLHMYNRLSNQQKYTLSNQCLSYQDKVSWDIQKELCRNSNNPLLVDRFQLMESKLLGPTSSLNLDFYMFYICYLNDSNDYEMAYRWLEDMPDSRNSRYWMIEIAFYLGKSEWLISHFETNQNDFELQALCLYRLFHLGYYQQGYLHQALDLLSHHSSTKLYSLIQQEIKQWGSLA